MFASFALFIKNCHTVNDDHAVFNLSDLRHCEKTCKTSNYRHRYTNEKPGKVTWDNSFSLDATTITLYIIDHLITVTKWLTNGVIIYRYVSRLLNITFYWPLCPTVFCFAYCIERRAQLNGTVIPWTILFHLISSAKMMKYRRAKWYHNTAR